MVWFSKLPLWSLQWQDQTQHPHLQQLRDAWKVAASTLHWNTRPKIYKSLVFLSWLSCIVCFFCFFGWVECSPPHPISSSVPAGLVYSIFRPFVFPQTAICVFRVTGTGSRACFSLSRGFNQRGIPEPWTETHTRAHTHRWRHVYTETHTPSRDGRLRCLSVRTPGWSEAWEKDFCHCFSARSSTLQ